MIWALFDSITLFNGSVIGRYVGIDAICRHIVSTHGIWVALPV